MSPRNFNISYFKIPSKAAPTQNTYEFLSFEQKPMHLPSVNSLTHSLTHSLNESLICRHNALKKLDKGGKIILYLWFLHPPNGVSVRN